MGFWSILRPEVSRVTNLVTNPSVEVATTGYTASGGSIARVTTKAKRGTACLQVTPTAGTSDGVYFASVFLTAGSSHTYSFDVWGAAGVPYAAHFADSSGNQMGTPVTFSGTGAWKRVSGSFTPSTDDNYRLYIRKNSSASTAVFYVDGVQVVKLDHDTSYIDGDQDDCLWSGEFHASQSSRSRWARGAGEEVDLEGLSVYVNSYTGVGMPPGKHHVLSQALVAGGKFQGRKVLPRTVTLQSDASGTSHANMHAVRQALIDLIKPDATKDDVAFKLRYRGSDSDNPLHLNCVYDSGMDFLSMDGFVEHPSLRVMAYDPFWYEDGNDSAVLATSQVISNANYLSVRIDGQWQTLSTGMNGIINVITVDERRGRVYFGGAFTTAGGVTVNRVCYWNGSSFVAMGATPGVAGGNVYAIGVAPNGDVYVGGAFTSAGGATADGLARWNYSAATWTAFAQGTPGDTIYTIDFNEAGNVIIGGNFLNWNANANLDYIMMYDGTSWTAFGTGMSGLVKSVKVGKDGRVWVGGTFASGNGVTLNSIGYWNGTTFVAMDGGIQGGTDVEAVHILPSGNVVIGGAFIWAGGSSTSDTMNSIAEWNGTSWNSLGIGADSADRVQRLTQDKKGLLYASGAFTMIGGVSLAGRLGIWNGTTWMHPDIIVPSTVSGMDESNGALFLGHNTAGAITASGKTVVTNQGSAKAYPIMKVRRTGGTSATLAYLRNETADRTIWFNYPFAYDEELTIDFRPERRSVMSSVSGDVWKAVLRSSDFADFFLLPGSNDIFCLVQEAGSPTITCTLEWATTHHSFDGG